MGIDFTNWEGGNENIGCPGGVCTGVERLGLRPLNGFQWNAIDKEVELPYLCISNCKPGYKWYPGILKQKYENVVLIKFLVTDTKKCLKVVHESVIYGEAAVRCAADHGKLAALRDCNQLEALSKELYQRYRTPGEEFMIGFRSAALMSSRTRAMKSGPAETFTDS